MNAFSAMQQYQAVNTQAQAAAADPHRLIQMLMEGGPSPWCNGTRAYCSQG